MVRQSHDERLKVPRVPSVDKLNLMIFVRLIRSTGVLKDHCLAVDRARAADFVFGEIRAGAHPAFSSRSKRSANQMRARVVASVVRSRASLLSTAFMAGGSRMLS